MMKYDRSELSKIGYSPSEKIRAFNADHRLTNTNKLYQSIYQGPGPEGEDPILTIIRQ